MGGRTQKERSAQPTADSAHCIASSSLVSCVVVCVVAAMCNALSKCTDNHDDDAFTIHITYAMFIFGTQGPPPRSLSLSLFLVAVWVRRVNGLHPSVVVSLCVHLTELVSSCASLRLKCILTCNNHQQLTGDVVAV